MSELTLPRYYEEEGEITLEMPLERRHNILRAWSGLIRKCLTLVKASLEHPDVLCFTIPLVTIATSLVTTALRFFSRIHCNLRRFATVVSSVAFLIKEYIHIKHILLPKRV